MKTTCLWIVQGRTRINGDIPTHKKYHAKLKKMQHKTNHLCGIHTIGYSMNRFLLDHPSDLFLNGPLFLFSSAYVGRCGSPPPAYCPLTPPTVALASRRIASASHCFSSCSNDAAAQRDPLSFLRGHSCCC